MPKSVSIASTTPRSKPREFTGTVVRVSGQKTAYVLVKSVKMHRKYRKQFITSKRYPVHDEANVAKTGDAVRFAECRPLSRTKRWRLLEIVNKQNRNI
ncbi:MAG: 30S ribosomal protein S17 [Candidatus Magasanikbacteria bacterium]|nr:30S ribosomal protein S17 [Candidatus Magasanikbacteria bacterium]